MAHIAPLTPPALISMFSRNTAHLVSPKSHKVHACTTTASDHQTHLQRRSVALGMAGAVLGLSIGGENARAAARRPPPPPPAEKKDPNVSGLAAKILASKKRKEAMKDEITKLREKGKAIQE